MKNLLWGDSVWLQFVYSNHEKGNIFMHPQHIPEQRKQLVNSINILSIRRQCNCIRKYSFKMSSKSANPKNKLKRNRSDFKSASRTRSEESIWEIDGRTRFVKQFENNFGTKQILSCLKLPTKRLTFIVEEATSSCRQGICANRHPRWRERFTSPKRKTKLLYRVLAGTWAVTSSNKCKSFNCGG